MAQHCHPPNHGSARFALDSGDLSVAKELGLLRSEISTVLDPASSDYGYFYDKQDNISVDEFESQKAAQQRCKTFAARCGFQLYVKHSSSKPNNSGNAKYACKVLNGQQFNDTAADSAAITCPFFINAFGKDGRRKLTAANFAHNHVKHIGSTRPLCVEGSTPVPDWRLRNTTQNMAEITALVETEVLPAHAGSVSTLKGKEITTFVMGLRPVLLTQSEELDGTDPVGLRKRS